ncbi:hypothetical protein JT092_04190 [Helicobacter pylori]|nr:hypothetical protein [Helicobacter pylori]
MFVSCFLNAIDPFNLGVLLSRFQIKNDRIYGVCSYKSSKFVPDYEKSKVQALNALNTLSAHPIWQSNQESVTKIKGTFVFILENDLRLDENSFYKKLLNSLIDNDFFNRSHSMTPNQKRFLSGFFESRGSIDTQRNFLTLDYFFHSPLEFNKFHYLIDFFNIPSEALNFNFRELQPEHAQGINQRNAQFRIYLDWYLYHIGLFNPYKARIAHHVFKTTLIYDGIYYKLNYVISLGKDQELDVLANLAKLCPACHRALKKGSSEEEFQKRLIRNILNHNKDNLEFAQLRFETDDFSTLVNRIHESLK